MNKKTMTRVCSECGSENVLKDAWASFDSESQKWVLDQVFDQGFCKDCDGECTINEKELCDE